MTKYYVKMFVLSHAGTSYFYYYSEKKKKKIFHKCLSYVITKETYFIILRKLSKNHFFCPINTHVHEEGESLVV